MPMRPVLPRDVSDLPRYHRALYLHLVERNVAERGMSPLRARAHAQSEAQAQSESLKSQLQRDAYVPSR